MEQQLEGDIFDAVQSGDIATVKKFLDKGVPVDLTDEEGWSLIHHAAALGQVEVINLLREKGCCVDLIDNEGRTPLHYAAMNGDIKTIRLLIAMGSNVNSVDNEGNTPLKWSVMCEQNVAIEELTKHGGTVEIEEMESSPDNLDRPPFLFPFQDPGQILGDKNNIEVSQSNQTELTTDIQQVSTAVKSNDSYKHSDHNSSQTDLVTTQQCMDTNADTTQLEGDIFEAAKCGDTTIVKEYLDSGGPVDLTDEDGRTLLHCAAGEGQIKVVELLIKKGCRIDPVDRKEWTPLDYATACGHVQTVRLLKQQSKEPLEKQNFIDRVDNKGRSVLYYAAASGDNNLIESILLGEQVLDVNISDDEGETPLHYAAAYGQYQSVLTLLRLGGRESMTKVAVNVGTPLHQAVAGGHKDILSLLLNAFCPINVVDNKGASVLHYAAQYGRIHMIEMLAEKGLDVNIDDNKGKTPLHYAAACGQLESVRTLLRLGERESVTKVAGTHSTPLHQAVGKGHKDIVSLLLNEDCPINVVGSEGRSILDYAAGYGRVDMVDNEGRTPLHYAAVNGDIETIRLLIAMGSNVNSVDNEGNTPLKWSVMSEQKAAIEELTKYGGTVDIEEIEPTPDKSDSTALCFPFQDPGQILGDGNNEVCHSNQTELTTDIQHVSTAVKSSDSYEHSDHNSRQTDLVTTVTQQCMDTNADTTQLEGDIFEAAQCGDTATVKGYLDLGVPVDVTDENGWSPVHHAIAHRQVEVIRLLMDRGCLMNPVKDRKQATKSSDLHNTTERGSKYSTYTEKRLYVYVFEAAQCGDTATIQAYLNSGGPVDLTDEDGRTLLHCAAGEGQITVVELLIKRGCRIDPVDNIGWTPSIYAAACDHVQTVQLLKQRSNELRKEQYSTDGVDSRGRSVLHVAAASGDINQAELLGGRETMTKVAGDAGTPLHQAVAEGHKDIVSLLLKEGCPINVVDSEGRSLLHYAAQYGEIYMIEMLAGQGLDVNIGDDEGWTPLHDAAACGQLESLRTLLRLGGRESMTKLVGLHGTPLHQAVANGHKDIVSLLLNEGCPINVVDSKGSSVLIPATQYGHIHMIEMLSEQGLDVNIGDDEGLTPLHNAAACGQLESLRTLLRFGGRKSLTKVVGLHGTPLHQAVANGHKDMVSLLLNEGCPINVVNSKGSSVLIPATQCGHIHMIEMLSEQGLDVNIGDDEGWTPLHDAAACGQLESLRTLLRLGGRESMTKLVGLHGTPLHQAVANGHKDIVSLLLNEGCPINVVDSMGGSVLHFAAQYGQIDMIEMLSEQGLDVNIGDNEGLTPLHKAAVYGQLESVRTLLRWGGKESMTKVAGIHGTPLHQAVGKGHKDMVSLLLNEGCPINVVNGKGSSVLPFAAQCGDIHMIEMLSEQGLDVNIGDDEGLTPLHKVAAYGQLESVRTFLRLGGRESMTKVAGTYGTPLHQAVGKGHKDIMSLLLNEGCPINVADSTGRSLLHYAAGGGQIYMIEMLSEQGLDVNIGDDEGLTPLHKAAAYGQLESVRTLLRLGGRESMTKVAGTHGTPLHQAVAKGHKDIVSLLLNEGCPSNLVDSGGKSVLHFAAQYGQIDMIEMLSEQGLDVNIGGDEGETPLYDAATYGQLESVRTLLRLGGRASMTKVVGEFGTPLHQAVRKGHKDIMSLLLNEGCPISVVNSEGRSLLHYAAQYGQIDMIEMLSEQGLDVNIGGDEGETPLYDAATYGQLESVRTLLRLGGRESMTKVVGGFGTPLQQAVAGGHKDIVSLLLNEGCPINVVDSEGRSVLHIATRFGQIDMIEMLSEQGLDVIIGDNEGVTPLHYAALYGQLESVRTLLRLGGRESMTKVAGACGTPVFQAVAKGHKDIASLLLDEGCPIVVGSEGDTFYHFAALFGRNDLIGMLAERGLDVNIRNNYGLTSLHHAAVTGHVTTFKELVSVGGNIHLMDEFGMKFSDWILMFENIMPVKQFCVACGFGCDDKDLFGVISALSANNLLDMNRILCLAAVFGNICIFDAMVTSSYPLNEQKMPKIVNLLSYMSDGGKNTRCVSCL